MIQAQQPRSVTSSVDAVSLNRDITSSRQNLWQLSRRLLPPADILGTRCEWSEETPHHNASMGLFVARAGNSFQFTEAFSKIHKKWSGLSDVRRLKIL